MRVFLVLGVEGLLGDTELPGDFSDGGTRFGLPEGVDELLLW